MKYKHWRSWIVSCTCKKKNALCHALNVFFQQNTSLKVEIRSRRGFYGYSWC